MARRSSRELRTCLCVGALVLSAGLAGCVRDGATQPVTSDPRTWATEFDEFRVATPACPHGDVRAARVRDPSMRPYAPKAYVAATGETLDALTGVRDSDEVYPLERTWTLPGGDYTAVRGFLLARDGCVIHVQVTGYDN